MFPRTATSLIRMVFVVTPLFGIVCMGCDTPLTGGDVSSEEPQSLPPEDESSLDVVRIEFRNFSTSAVDTQFYASNEAFDLLPQDLLIPQNLIQTGIGVGGTGILGPLAADEIELPCSELLVVGTAGGKFLDADLGTDLGSGPVRFMQAEYQFDCGATLILEYRQTIDGYTVNLFQEN
ncbi:MAG: hypothetical protein KAV82_13620 [Phycisphaerae bacterium]|nr:hypothetical protein [Phycisphaerae bacterium]